MAIPEKELTYLLVPGPDINPTQAPIARVVFSEDIATLPNANVKEVVGYFLSAMEQAQERVLRSWIGDESAPIIQLPPGSGQ